MVLKEFFQSKKEISTFTTITSMWNKDNILVNNWVEMEAVCLDYFDLYNSPPQSPENEVAIEQILDLLVDKLPQSAKNILARSLSKIELLHVAKDMAIGKSPGPDGYAIKYYTRDRIHGDGESINGLWTTTKENEQGSYSIIVQRRHIGTPYELAFSNVVKCSI
jgi:hypothetical protein